MRVLVIGNSFMGALKCAVDSSPYKEMFHFIGNPGKDFRNIRVKEDGCFNEVFFSSDDNINVKNYDSIFIFGDLTSPIILEYRLSKANFSSSFSNDYWSESIKASHSYDLANMLNEICNAGIYLIPGNYVYDWKGYVDNTNDCFLLANSFSEYYILSAAEGIYGLDGRIEDQRFYSGSVLIHGKKPGLIADANHDKGHLNPEGGAVILGNIVKFLDIWALELIWELCVSWEYRLSYVDLTKAKIN